MAPAEPVVSSVNIVPNIAAVIEMGSEAVILTLKALIAVTVGVASS